MGCDFTYDNSYEIFGVRSLVKRGQMSLYAHSGKYELLNYGQTFLNLNLNLSEMCLNGPLDVSVLKLQTILLQLIKWPACMVYEENSINWIMLSCVYYLGHRLIFIWNETDSARK